MTNIIATIVAVLTTNWVTVSRTFPVIPSGHESDAVMRYATLNQTGIVVTNYVATITWKGRPHSIILESIIAAQQPKLERSIMDAWGITNLISLP